MKAESSDVIVIGGGAAGLLAALQAARSGGRVILLEGSRACGLKILVSGGGRCNVLPSEFSESDFFTSGSRAVLRRLFRTWPLDRVRQFFERELDVPLTVEADTGKVFPTSQQSRDVRDALVFAAEQAGVALLTEWRVGAVASMEDGFFEVTRTNGEALRARRVVLATGGKSMPRTGSDGIGYNFATAFGHSILDPYPALVPLRTDDPSFPTLTGIALPVEWTVRHESKVLERRTRELLFTHRGYSGPAMLDASHWNSRDRETIEIRWGSTTQDEWSRRLRAGGSRPVAALIGEELPRRLADILCQRAGLAPGQPLSQLRRDAREKLLVQLCACPLPVSGNEGYRKAEVTGGGVPLSEINPSTLESRKQPGLYLCGEILDVIGRIGGYNFLWAWVTGRLAGEKAAGSR